VYLQLCGISNRIALHEKYGHMIMIPPEYLNDK
jgi:hypothetical protein